MNRIIAQIKGRTRCRKACHLLLLVVVMTATSGSHLAMAAPVKSIPIRSFIKNFWPKKYRLEVSGDAVHRKVILRARGAAGLQLYLFNVEGQLIWHRNVEANGREWSVPVESGQYLYELFADDERIDNGRLAIK